MIVIGYQGIGKSTLARESKGFVDLESSCFYVNGKRSTDWHYYYCRIAENLSEQGYVVFVSSHMPVRDWFKRSDERAVIICPDIALKDAWIQRLYNRWVKNRTGKNYRAWRGAAEKFEDNIHDLMEEGIPVLKIKDIHYDLEDMIRVCITKNPDINLHDRQIWPEGYR